MSYCRFSNKEPVRVKVDHIQDERIGKNRCSNFVSNFRLVRFFCMMNRFFIRADEDSGSLLLNCPLYPVPSIRI